MRRIASLFAALTVVACTHNPPRTTPNRELAQSVAVYRAIAESIYVTTTGRVIAVSTVPLDTTCARSCASLASRWGLDYLWWAHGDTTAAVAARDDLLSRAAKATSFGDVTAGRAMLLPTDPDDVPPLDADVSEWIRFRSTHADAAGALRISPVGFSPSGRDAIAFVDWRCGPTCGHTLGVSLTATSDSTWAISQMLLISSRGSK
jgi:hypothetical protein